VRYLAESALSVVLDDLAPRPEPAMTRTAQPRPDPSALPTPAQLAQLHDKLLAQAEALARAQAAVEAERRRYQELVDFAPDAYLVTDPAGRILEANRAASALFATPRTYVVGKPLTAFVAPADGPRLSQRLERLRQGAYAAGLHLELRARPRRFTAELRLSAHVGPVRADDGTLCAVRWMLHVETTERRAATARREPPTTDAATLRHQLIELEAVVRMKDMALTIDQARREQAAAALTTLVDAGGADAAALRDALALLHVSGDSCAQVHAADLERA
jgi:PAS domain S-box-containing protein